MKIMFIDNNGAGFADTIDIPAGMTIQQLFDLKVGAGKDSGYLIRVNRLPVARDTVLSEGDRISLKLVARDTVLNDGDRVTVTPTKIEGADDAGDCVSLEFTVRVVAGAQ